MPDPTEPPKLTWRAKWKRAFRETEANFSLLTLLLLILVFLALSILITWRKVYNTDDIGWVEFSFEVIPSLFCSTVATLASVWVAKKLIKRDPEEDLVETIIEKLRVHPDLSGIAKTALDKIVSHRLFQELVSQIGQKGAAGIVAVHNGVAKFSSDIRSMFESASADDHLIVIDNWLYDNDLNTWEEFVELIKGALQLGARVTFVLMHPNSPVARRRADTLKNTKRDDIVSYIMRSLSGIREIYKEYKVPIPGRRDNEEVEEKVLEEYRQRQFKVYCVDTHLSIQLYGVHGIYCQGYYTADQTSSQGPHLRVTGATDMGTMMKAYIRKIETLCRQPSQCAVRVRLGETHVDDALSVEEVLEKLVPIQLHDFVDSLVKLGAMHTSAEHGRIRQFLRGRHLDSTQYALVLGFLEKLVVELGSEHELHEQSDAALSEAELNGAWNGLHMTRDENGCLEHSLHLYDLTVKPRRGGAEYAVSGWHEERSRPGHPRYKVTGRIVGREMVFTAESSANELSGGLVQIALGWKRMEGFYVVHDWTKDERLFSTMIVLWRGSADEKAVAGILRDMLSAHRPGVLKSRRCYVNPAELRPGA